LLGGLLSLVLWFVFGAGFLLPALERVGAWSVVYAVGSLTVVRMVPVALSLVGAGQDRNTVAFLGWFGPRGLASVIFALLAGDEAGPDVHPQPEQLGRRIDAEALDPQPPEPVADDVAPEQRAGSQRPRPAPVEQQQDGHQRKVPERLVEERRVEGADVRVPGRPVLDVDLQPPGQVGRPSEQLLVEPVAEP